MTKDEALELALGALERSVATCFGQYAHQQVMSQPDHFINQTIAAIKEALAQPEREPFAWVYPEGLEALKAGKPWTAYGRRQEPNNTGLYLSPQPDIAPYAWVTFTPYGDEDDVWYENPEGQLPEGWTYKPLYDTTPPQREWVGLTNDEIAQAMFRADVIVTGPTQFAFARDLEAKLKEKNNG